MHPAEQALLAELRQLTTQLVLTILGATLLVSAVLLAPRARGGALLVLLGADWGRLLFTLCRRSEIKWEADCGYSCTGSG